MQSGADLRREGASCREQEDQMRKSSVVHTKKGNDHTVVVNALRVLITEEPNGWFAQGVEVDYFASGETLEDVQRRFVSGLTASIVEHLQRYGDLQRLIKWAPANVRNKLKTGQYSNITPFPVGMNVDDARDAFPFNNLNFLKEERNQAA